MPDTTMSRRDVTDDNATGFRFVGDGFPLNSDIYSADGKEKLLDVYHVAMTVNRHDGCTVTYYRGTPHQALAAGIGENDMDLSAMDAVVVRHAPFAILGGFIQES